MAQRNFRLKDERVPRSAEEEMERGGFIKAKQTGSSVSLCRPFVVGNEYIDQVVT